MYLAKNVAGWSLPKIGRFYNGRHHTTVLHAIAKIERLRQTDEAFDSLIDVLMATLTSETKNFGAGTGGRWRILNSSMQLPCASSIA